MGAYITFLNMETVREVLDGSKIEIQMPVLNRKKSPLGKPGDTLIIKPEHTQWEPCIHRGCKNHITHPCEGCGRFWGEIETVITQVEIKQVYDDSGDDFFWRWCYTFDVVY